MIKTCPTCTLNCDINNNFCSACNYKFEIKVKAEKQTSAPSNNKTDEDIIVQKNVTITGHENDKTSKYRFVAQELYGD